MSMRKAGMLLPVFVLLIWPQASQALQISQEIEITVPAAIEIQILRSSETSFDGMEITRESTLGLRSNTSWNLQGKAASALSYRPEIYLDGKAGATTGEANKNNSYQEIDLKQLQKLSWQDDYGYHSLSLTLEVTPTL